MKYVHEPPRTTPVLAETEVLVVLSDPAGLAAAIATAREGVKTMLAAVRCVSGDKTSHAALRSMMCYTVTGQGAGVAAAMSLKDRVNCGDMEISRVQKALQIQGVRIN